MLASCGVADGGKVMAKDVLQQHGEADIFQYNGFIYSNMTEVDWFQEEKENYLKQEEIGAIQSQSTDAKAIHDFTATKLPVGTTIYRASKNEKDTGILIVEYEGELCFIWSYLKGRVYILAGAEGRFYLEIERSFLSH